MQLSDFFPSMKGGVPVTPMAQATPAPQLPNDQTQVSGYLRTTLPLPLQYSPDTLRQYNRPGLSSFRIAPLPPGGSPSVNAASTSSVISTVQQFVNTAAGGSNGNVQFNNSGGLAGTNNFNWNNVASALTITGSLSVSTPIPIVSGGTGTSTPALVAGQDITITGSWPNNTIRVAVQGGVTPGAYAAANITVDSSGIITAVASGAGTLTAGNDISVSGTWPNNTVAVKVQSGVTAGSYTNTNLTVDAQGIITAVATGSSGFTNPMTTLGDIIYENAVPAATRLAGNITSTKNFLVQTGTGAVSAAPVWGTIVAADVPNLPASIITSGQIALANGGTNADLSGTGGASQVLRQSSVGAAVSVSQLSYSDISGVVPSTGLVSGSVNLTAQTANHAAATIFAVVSAGTYLITVYIVVSQAATTSSTLPDTRIIFTDADSNATITVPITSGLTTNTTSTFAQATFIVNAKASTNIQYDIGQVTPYASVGGTPMQFGFHARAVFLG